MGERHYTIEGPLRASYLALRTARTGRQTRTLQVTIDIDRLASAEEALAVKFDGPALLLFGEDGVKFADVLKLQAKAREREVPKGLLALAYDEHVWTCLKLNKSESSIVLYHDGEKTETSLLLSEWFDRERGELTHGALKAAPDIEGAELEVAALRQNAARAASYRVHHTKFGEGTVLSEEGTGENQKLEVAFADGTTRKLLARFVKRVD